MKNDDNYKRAVEIGYLFTVMLALFIAMIIFFMSSCTCTEAVYQHDNGWKCMPNKSTVTGWKYSK